MAMTNAQRQAKKRKEDAEYRILRGARDYKLTFEAFRGTTAALVRLCEDRGLEHPEQVNELVTMLIHEADKKL